ncbi:MAG TPA: ComF family protein [Gammaproteobacteria bacterium]|nr:ComF family protein [Gammaproteobacteria bacterium]
MVYSALLACLLPARCPGCGARTARALCADCRAELREVTNPCRRCGLGLPVSECPRDAAYWHCASVLAPYAYVAPLQRYVRALKFGGQRNTGRLLGELLLEHVLSTRAAEEVDVLVAVPLHRRRLIERGYNQAVEIARPLAATLRLPLWIAGISRPRATAAQSQLDARQRRANLHGAFAVSRAFDGLRVALIDDVLTTGATSNALALELLRAGATAVHAWAVARSL